MPQTTTIDQTSKISLGILGSMLVGIGGGAIYLSTLNANVIHVADSLQEVKEAINRNTETLTRDGKNLAILEALVNRIEMRVSKIEDARELK